jgi:hypothetical protein
MILRALEPSAPASQKLLPAWEAVEHTQTQAYKSCWMITQPSHAVLAGDLAGNLRGGQFPVADQDLLQAITLHDAGWGVLDAQAIMRSRSLQRHPPQSFLAMDVPQFLEAWEKSIEAGGATSAAGGYVVSRHFWRLAEHRARSAENKLDRQKLESFLKTEAQRQQKLAARQSLSIQQLEELTDFLQFCDLLSLYFCCGTRESVIFPKYFGVALRAKNHNETYKLDPPLIQSGAVFTVAALRHPATKAESSRQMPVKIA